tara:strand:+ start:1958 stop:4150 length:2193 start_codon:yes stop_codon:yes gene_type:complete
MKKLIFCVVLFNISLTSFTQNVFDLGIRNIEIFFSEPNWHDTLNVYYANNSGQRLVADSIIIDGEIDHDVGIKYKGNSSYSANNAKNPLNIKLDHIINGQSIDRYNILKLSNGFHDPTFVREVLTYHIAREYMPAPKATYANVFINGVYNGLYGLIQSIDDDFTNENFYERKGPLFKAENTGVTIPGCQGQLGILEYYNDTNCYQRAYEMQSSNDWGKLGYFLDTLNNHFGEIESVMDIDRTLWMMALLNLTVSLDGPINNIPHNFYLFEDNNGRFSPILWDLNSSFGTFRMSLTNPISNQDLQELSVFHDNNNNNNMCNKIVSSNQYKRMYIAHMRTILNDFFVNSTYKSLALQLQSLIDSSYSIDTNRFYSYTDFIFNIDSAVGQNNSIIGLNQLMQPRVNYIQSLPEFTVTTPIINNIVSSPSNPTPHTSVTISAQVTNASDVFLGYRFKFHDKFIKTNMVDNGSGLYSASINLDARDVQYYIYAENNDAGIFSPERAEKEFHQLAVVDNLVINEIMASNVSAIADQSGEYDDWVELYNGNNFSLNLNGYYLSDSENDLTKWSFPNVSIPANSYLIVWCDTAGNTQSGLHTTYRLSADQEEVYLSSPVGNIIDAVHFVNMENDISYARVPNGSGAFTHQSETFNKNNQNISGFNSYVDNKIRVYPNPSNDRVYILGIDGEFSIYNMFGQELFSDCINGRTISIDISRWNTGVYFIKTNNLTKKIIKQ